MSSNRKALVFGGTGYVGTEVIKALSSAEIPTLFTYFRSEEQANQLMQLSHINGKQVDLREPAQIQALFAHMAQEGFLPDIFIHCATVGDWSKLSDISPVQWSELQQVNTQSAFFACQMLSSRLIEAQKSGDLVFVTAMTGVMAVPAPVHFASTQGAILGMMRALSKELGQHNIRSNAVMLGILEGGISQKLDKNLLKDYQHFSSLGRLGTAEEAAKPILWLALQNESMSGATLNVNGGL